MSRREQEDYAEQLRRESERRDEESLEDAFADDEEVDDLDDYHEWWDDVESEDE